MSEHSILPCIPPEIKPDFSSLGDVNRAGVMFCDSPQNFNAIWKVQQYRTFRVRCLATTLSMIDSMRLPSQALVSVRLKRLDSIRRKIGRVEFNFTLGQMDDIIGVRIVCSTFRDALAMSERVQAASEFHKTKNYICESHPKQTGYRAEHHIMLFQQALTEEIFLNVRFEIQVRSYLQHLWAIWSESHGEETKAGHASDALKNELQEFSSRIAHWEKSNPDKKQEELIPYTNVKNIVVAWRQKKSMPLCIPFRDNADAAVRYLNYLETKYPAKRGNALLLVGVSSPNEAIKVLRKTHPLYTMSRAIAPEFWMPPGS